MLLLLLYHYPKHPPSLRSFLSTNRRRSSDSTNGCAVIAPLVGFRHIKTKGWSKLPSNHIEHVIGNDTAPILSTIRAKVLCCCCGHANGDPRTSRVQFLPGGYEPLVKNIELNSLRSFVTLSYTRTVGGESSEALHDIAPVIIIPRTVTAVCILVWFCNALVY